MTEDEARAALRSFAVSDRSTAASIADMPWKLDRQGYRLVKSRARDPRDIIYGGHMIVDPGNGGAVYGGGMENAGRGYSLDLNDVEQWATE